MSESLIDLAWLVYFINTLATEDYNYGLGILGAFSIIMYLCYCFIPEEAWASGLQAKVGKVSKTGVLLWLCYSLYYTLVPSKETAWTVTGIIMAAKVVDNPEIQNLTSEGVKILEKKLKLYSRELDDELGAFAEGTK